MIGFVAGAFLRCCTAEVDTVLAASDPSASTLTIDVVPVVFKARVGLVAIGKFLQPA